ncbi:MAG: nucleotidyltransferase family protein, partial [Anaerolineaceae bacterium]|nr:nucleotidyltransferase family protein [Anaerolineaceae bacterium]
IIPKEKVTIFCQKWNVVEFALFGSVLRTDFNNDSDIDVLVSFAPSSHNSLFDLAQMQIELQKVFGRQVDLVEKSSLKNPYRKSEIIESALTVFQSKNQL